MAIFKSVTTVPETHAYWLTYRRSEVMSKLVSYRYEGDSMSYITSKVDEGHDGGVKVPVVPSHGLPFLTHSTRCT